MHIHCYSNTYLWLASKATQITSSVPTCHKQCGRACGMVTRHICYSTVAEDHADIVNAAASVLLFYVTTSVVIDCYHGQGNIPCVYVYPSSSAVSCS